MNNMITEFELEQNIFYYNVSEYTRLILSYNMSQYDYRLLMDKYNIDVANSPYYLEFNFDNFKNDTYNSENNDRMNKLIDNELKKLKGEWCLSILYDHMGKFKRIVFFSDKKEYIRLKLLLG